MGASAFAESIIVDRVHPLKIEDSGDGTQTDPFPTALNKNEDWVDVRGITLQSLTSNDSSVRIARDPFNNLTLYDPLTGLRTLRSMLSELTDSLALNLMESSYTEHSYDGDDNEIDVTTYVDNTKAVKIRSCAMTRDVDDKMLTRVTVHYSAHGIAIVGQTLTETFTYDVDGRLFSNTAVRS
jgi:hypothetical protein